jgi:hypothetical protein
MLSGQETAIRSATISLDSWDTVDAPESRRNFAIKLQ